MACVVVDIPICSSYLKVQRSPLDIWEMADIDQKLHLKSSLTQVVQHTQCNSTKVGSREGKMYVNFITVLAVESYLR